MATSVCHNIDKDINTHLGGPWRFSALVFLHPKSFQQQKISVNLLKLLTATSDPKKACDSSAQTSHVRWEIRHASTHVCQLSVLTWAVPLSVFVVSFCWVQRGFPRSADLP